jgi:ATP-dependent Zn protease
MRLIPPAVVAVFHSVVLFAQEAEPRQASPFWTALITWLPFIILIVLWLFFMRKIGGRKGYTVYMDNSQERLASIDESLKRIASSVERLEAGRKDPSPPTA